MSQVTPLSPSPPFNLTGPNVEREAGTRLISFKRSSKVISLAALSLLSALFVVSRVLFLDRDVPRYDITELQPIDEFFYTIPAFNLFHHGAMAYRVVPFIPSDGAPVNVLQNVLTFLTLSVFGNNYYGLRMASVLAGVAVFFLLFLILRRAVGLYWTPPLARARFAGGGHWAPWAMPLLCLAYLVSDFSFNWAARVAEPTIFRMLAMVVVLFVVSAWSLHGSPSMWRAVAIGFLGTAAFVYVYVYNAFIVPAVVVTLIVEALPWGWRGVVRQLVAGAVGAAVAILSFAMVVYATYGQSVFDVYRIDIAPFGSRLSTAALAATLPVNFVSIFSTNIFRFDLPLLVAFALALPVFAHRLVRERSSLGILAASLLFFLVLQSAIAADTPFRKLAMLDPLVVLVVGMAVPSVQRIIDAIRSSPPTVVATTLYLLLAAAGIYRIFQRQAGALGPRFEVLSTVCLLLLVASLGALWLTRRWTQIFVAAAAAALILPGAALSVQRLFLDATYHYRDAMVAAAPLLDGHVTAGGFSYGFRLYNTSQPVLNPYQYQYSASGIAEYNADLSRLFSEGISRRSVAVPDSVTLLGLGLRPAAIYFIHAKGSPYIVVYGLPQS